MIYFLNYVKVEQIQNLQRHKVWKEESFISNMVRISI